MKLLKATNYWNCSLASMAMVVGSSIEELEKIIGHDGSQIINVHLKSPGNRKGFHWQELIDAAFTLGFAMIPIEACPVQTALGHDIHDVKFEHFLNNEERFKSYLQNTVGILAGKAPSGFWHAVAWNGLAIYDPRGKVYGIADCKINLQIYWLFAKMANNQNHF